MDDEVTVTRRLRWPVIAAVGLWFAMVAGLVEFATRQLEFHVFGRAIHIGGSAIWMIPMFNAVLFLVISLLVAGIGRLMPRLAEPRAVLTIFAVLGVCSGTLLLPRLQVVAQLLLGVGLAVAVLRLRWLQGPVPLALVRRTVPHVIGLVALLGFGYEYGARWAERRALDRLPAAQAGAPNVLLLILDTVRAFSLSAYGYQRPTTPKLEQLASRGVLFERAMVTAPWTLPSHATMFTGYYPHQMSAGFVSPLDESQPTLAELLSKAGYATAGVVANIAYTSREHGLARGFTHYGDFNIAIVTGVRASSWGRFLHGAGVMGPIYRLFGARGRKSATAINEEFLAWLPKRAGRPFFAFLNYYDAHLRYTAPPPFDTMFLDPTLPDYPKNESENIKDYSPGQLKRANQAYDGSIAYIDHEIGQLMDRLDREGILDNTIVVIGSDHGEQFGEHNRVSHGNSLFRQLLQVPLIVVWPRGGLRPGRVATPVSYRDLPATILDLTKTPNAGSLPGIPLTNYLRQSDSVMTGGSPVFSAYSADRDLRRYSYSIIADGAHYIRWLTDQGIAEHLFELEADPAEENNLIGRPELQDRLPRLRWLMDSIVASAPRGPLGK